jgi:SET domain-containing protein
MIWNEEATYFPGTEQNLIIPTKYAKINDFRRKSISTTTFSILEYNPIIQQAVQLRNWFRSRTQILHKLSVMNQI